MPTREQAADAVRAIRRRRRTAGHRVEQLPDAADLDGMLAYLAAYPARQVDALADRLDGLVIAMYLRRRAEEWQFAMMRGARAHGARWADFTAALGVTSAQGAQQAYQRLEQGLQGNPRSEVGAREADTHARELRAVARAAPELREVIAELADACLVLPPELAEDARYLADDAAAAPATGPLPAGVVAGLRLLLGELLDTPGLPDRVRAVVARGVEALVSGA